MGNGWHEWPLVIFTVLGQCVVGALIVAGVAWLRERDPMARNRLVRSMFFLWLVMGVGFVASILHLGSPLRAFNSLNRVGASGLSNEIASGTLFFAVGGFWWLVAVLGKMPAVLGRIWLVLSMVLLLLHGAYLAQWLHHPELLPDHAARRPAVRRPAGADGEGAV